MICHYLFFYHGLEFQDCECSGCRNLPLLIVNITDIAIITVKNVDYCCIVHNISKSEAINPINPEASFILSKTVGETLVFCDSYYYHKPHLS